MSSNETIAVVGLAIAVLILIVACVIDMDGEDF